VLFILYHDTGNSIKSGVVILKTAMILPTDFYSCTTMGLFFLENGCPLADMSVLIHTSDRSVM
jgi:hypothetical protein